LSDKEEKQLADKTAWLRPQKRECIAPQNRASPILLHRMKKRMFNKQELIYKFENESNVLSGF